MAIAYRAKGATSKVQSGNLASVGLPAGHVANDILRCTVQAQDNVVNTMPAGWVRLSGVNNGASDRQELWFKRDNGAESAPTVTHAAGGIANAVIEAWSGIDSGLAIAIGAGGILRDLQVTTGNNQTTFTFPALTGVVSGDMRAAAGGFTANDTSGATTNNWGTITGWTEDLDDCSDLTGAWAVSLGLDHLLATGAAGSVTATVGWGGAFTTWTWICTQMAFSSDTSTAVIDTTGFVAARGRPGFRSPANEVALYWQPALDIVNAPITTTGLEEPDFLLKPNPRHGPRGRVVNFAEPTGPAAIIVVEGLTFVAVRNTRTGPRGRVFNTDSQGGLAPVVVEGSLTFVALWNPRRGPRGRVVNSYTADVPNRRRLFIDVDTGTLYMRIDAGNRIKRLTA